ncbi:MAG: aminotransferase class V-fold PLP-dependent enzyme [Oscillospiraceae bacterium]|nr:aminotransferase class V-fold PLP-dependent enzyme [Oscillospiraceae bacterium]
MRNPVYFDNAATTFPKPPVVLRAFQNAARFAGGNPGRGGHILSRRAGETVYHARETAAALFGAEPENVVFTMNCTHALNLAIRGTLRKGDHVIISGIEHNSAARPVAAMAEDGLISYSVAPVSTDDAETVAAFRARIRPQTKAIICTLAGNVTGQIMPYRELGALCREKGLIFIADGAQGCGILPVTLQDGIHLLCTAGHKGLYGLMGTGMLISDGTVTLRPLMQGGTGTQSASLQQPTDLPEALEAGTVNVPGIAALDAGMQWIVQRGAAGIAAHENALCDMLTEGLRRIPGAVVYRDPNAKYVPVVSFALADEMPDDTAARLAEKGFCLRAGLQCAPLAHQTLGTPGGTVRFSPSAMNTPEQVKWLLSAAAERGKRVHITAK